MANSGLAFGIGSIFFEIDSQDMSQWVPSVTSTLEAIPSVGNIEIRFPTDFTVQAFDKAYPSAGWVKFTVNIPKRIQKELWPLLRGTDLGETFSVMMVHELLHPVTFIVSESSTTLNSGSSAVVLIREFLESELKARPGKAQLRTLGPSPLHIEAKITARDQPDRFSLERTKRRGYDLFAFTYAQDAFSSIHDAAEQLFLLLANELALFYDLVERRNRRRNITNNIANETRRLIDRYQDSRIRIRLIRFLTSGITMRRLILKAITAEYENQRDISQSAVSIKDLYSSNQFPCFKDYLENEVTDTFQAELSNTKDIIAILGEDRSQQIQVTSLFLSALAGGLAGALISIIIH